MRRALTAMLLAACATLTPADYAGLWTNSTGTQTTTCPGSSPQTASFAAGTLDITIADAGNGNISLSLGLDPTQSCVVTASVDFDATLQPTTCTLPGGTLGFTTGHATLNDAHTMLHLVADATATGSGATCMQHYDVTLGRVTR